MSLNPDPALNPSEPALTVGGLTSAVGALLTLLLAFGVDLTETQAKAILGVVLVAGPWVIAAITRGKVYSPASVAKMLSRNS